jgi:hypothetical protein
VSADLGTWWSDLSAAALVGTARRQVPRLPAMLGVGRPGASPEVALLDAAALGGALRVAGMRTRKPEQVKAADQDRRSLPPSRAVHLLELLLHQSPVGGRLVPILLQVWLDAADAGEHRVPHHLLPDLLDLASGKEQLRSAVRRAGDARATWLAAINPAWAWAASDPTPSISAAHPVDAEAWAQRPTDRRVHEVARLRETDPAAARSLVESTWGGEAANDRLALLSTFRRGLGPDDESLLEQALDDRSAKVREVAFSLLDGLPTSAPTTARARRAGGSRPGRSTTYLLGGEARRRRTCDHAEVRRPRRLIELAVATLATDRALLLLGVPARPRRGCPSTSRRRSPATRRCSCRAPPARRRRRCATAGTTPGCSPRARRATRWCPAR